MSNAIYYMMPRKYFTGGVIVLDLKRINNFSEFRRKFELTLIKKLRLHSSSMRQVIEQADNEDFAKHLVSFFNQTDDEFILNYKKRDQRSKLTFLLCFDNCEDLLSSKDPKDFQKLIL